MVMNTLREVPAEKIPEVPEWDFPEQAEFKTQAMTELSRHPYVSPLWIANPHIQTSWSVFYRKRPDIEPRHERWDTPDHDFLNLYFIDGEPEKPVALLLHGLEGSVRSNYILGLMDSFKQKGWGVVVFEHRTCGGTMNKAKRTYHSGDASDLHFVVHRLIEQRPDLRLYIAGFSLGGNVTGRWLGMLGESIPDQVKATSLICPPFDLTVSGPHLDSVLWGAYTKWFFRTLKPKALEKAEQYPGVMDVERIKSARTFAEYDTHATAVLHGFRDAHDYWSCVSCGQYLHGVRRPTLLLASADDPFNPPETLPRAIADESPFLHPQFTEKGGHVGFVYGSWQNSRHWAEEQTIRFFELYDELLK